MRQGTSCIQVLVIFSMRQGTSCTGNFKWNVLFYTSVLTLTVWNHVRQSCLNKHVCLGSTFLLAPYTVYLIYEEMTSKDWFQISIFTHRLLTYLNPALTHSCEVLCLGKYGNAVIALMALKIDTLLKAVWPFTHPHSLLFLLLGFHTYESQSNALHCMNIGFIIISWKYVVFLAK